MSQLKLKDELNWIKTEVNCIYLLLLSNLSILPSSSTFPFKFKFLHIVVGWIGKQTVYSWDLVAVVIRVVMLALSQLSPPIGNYRRVKFSIAALKYKFYFPHFTMRHPTYGSLHDALLFCTYTFGSEEEKKFLVSKHHSVKWTNEG